MMCQMAQLNYEMTVFPEVNCNCMGRDQVSLIGRNKTHVDCEERAAHYKKWHATWGAIERELNEDDICQSNFSYGVMLRDPMQLAVSQMNFAGFTPEEARQHLHCVGHNPASCDAVARDSEKGFEKSKAGPLWKFFDNYLVRVLGGFDTFSLPAGAVTKEHADMVIKRLSSFDAVLFVEEINKQPSIFKTCLGWSKGPEHLSVDKHINGHRHILDLTPEEYLQAEYQNRFDYHVYNRFWKLPITTRCKSATSITTMS